MARLFEHQGKTILKNHKVAIPRGFIASSGIEAKKAAEELGGSVVIKAQTWTTGRASCGGVKFADTPEEALIAAESIIGSQIKGFTVKTVLVEEKLKIKSEYFAGIIIDDSAASPVLIFSSVGGTGIEEIAKEHPDKLIRYTIDIGEGLPEYKARNLVRKTGISGKAQSQLADFLVKLYSAAEGYECRSCEVNPLVMNEDDKVMAADCHITIDDYGVFRHQDLDIPIARELSTPPSELDMIAFNVEKNDYRGTFYFIQMERQFDEKKQYVGFQGGGGGGGGSMMSMDALTAAGFTIANFCDTSGNPPPSKVYRAAKIIMAQGPICGYFASGSGVASQEQFNTARGLVKAFRENWITFPAVLRLGGNQEEKAIQIITDYLKDLPATVECYGKDDSALFCAQRLRTLIDEGSVKESIKPEKSPHSSDYSFETVTGGTVSFDYSKCRACTSKICVEECQRKILKLNEEGCPELNITPDEAKSGKCSECLVCEVDCRFKGCGGGRIELPITGLSDYIAARERA